MITKTTLMRALAAISLAGAALSMSPFAAQAQVSSQVQSKGVLRLKSTNSFDETVLRLKSEVQAKGIRLFDQIDQSGLGAQANLTVGRSTLVIFGNPPLGVQFLQANPYSGLDWPVRMLVVQESDGGVYVAWTDFAEVAARYGLMNRDAQLKMASEVAASIAAAAASH